jgi:hypothetical protein
LRIRGVGNAHLSFLPGEATMVGEPTPQDTERSDDA